MSYPSAVTTERLDLRPVDPVADLEALGRLFADPGQAAMQAPAFVDADAPFIAWAAEQTRPRDGWPNGSGSLIAACESTPTTARHGSPYTDRELDDELMPPLRA